MPYIGDLATTLCSSQTSKRVCAVRCVAVVLGVLILVATLRTIVQQLQATPDRQLAPEYQALQTLTIEQIADIQIVDRCTLSTTQVAAVLQALHDITDFRLLPKPASYFGRLRITLRSSQIREFRLYQQSYGMVLEHISDADLPTTQASPDPSRSVTYVFSYALPNALRCDQA
jgi:hypothetical protein